MIGAKTFAVGFPLTKLGNVICGNPAYSPSAIRTVFGYPIRKEVHERSDRYERLDVMLVISTTH